MLRKSHCIKYAKIRFNFFPYDLRVPKISQDMHEVLFADIIFQYSFDSENPYFWMFYAMLQIHSKL